MKIGVLMMTFGANRCLTIKTKKEMKKNLFMVAAVALLALVSCNKEEINNGGVEQPKQPSVIVEFTASLGDQALKTTLSGGKTLWLETDEISINGEVFKVNKLIDGGASASFVNKNELPAGFGAPYTALYPANVTEVPATQNAYAGKFDPTAVLETATSDDNFLSFKNVTALLKFQVPVACSSITLTSDDVLAGADATTVTVNGDMVTGTDYYVAVLPGTKANFAVKIEDYVVKSAASVNIDRSKIITMPLPYNVYLHANTSKYNWTSDGARFATWTWGTGVTDSWFDMVAEGHDDVYRLEVPTGYANLIFCRLDGTKTDNNWDNVWNQTSDQVIPTDNSNHFYISDATLGAWGDKDYTFPVIKPKDGYLYLKPSSEWLKDNAHFAAWIWKDNGAGKVYNFKAHESVPGIYEINLNGANKMILFRMDPNKKVTDGSSWPGDNQWYKSENLQITGNLYTVVGWHASGTGFSTITEF